MLDISSKEYGAESEKGCNGDNHHEEGQAIEQGLQEGGIKCIQEDMHGDIDTQEASYKAILKTWNWLFRQLDTSVAMVANRLFPSADI